MEFGINDRVCFALLKILGWVTNLDVFWHGPFIVVHKLSHLNYKIVDMKWKASVVHSKCLKGSYGQTAWVLENSAS